jgi:pyridoxamine 5'-phosphate oxidase
LDLEELAALREANQARGLSEEEAAADPYDQFRAWHDDVVAAGLPEPYAMVLATADAAGRPRARNVLWRRLDERGFVWFTNHDSTKSAHVAANPVASLLFSWFAIGRQVLVSGSVERIGEDESDAYWVSRPRGSQLASWASKQSRVIRDRAGLERRYAEFEDRFADGPVPRPPSWGGHRLRPDDFEFWHGRPMRLHDRLRYVRDDTHATGWRIERLAP